MSNHEKPVIAAEYDVTDAFFKAPESFSMTIGSGEIDVELMKRCPPGAKVELRVGGTVMFSGEMKARS